ncbi:MAG: hypothetical protein AAFN77_18260 [Planctomycetota bacterium]
MSAKSQRKLVLAATVIVIVASLVAIVLIQPWRAPDRIVNDNEQNQEEVKENAPKTSVQSAKDLADALGLKEEDIIDIGGVLRPKRDLAAAKPRVTAGEKNPIRHPGRALVLNGDENPQVAGLFEELQQEDAPQAAKSALYKPKPFDLKEYQKDPQAYVDKIRPGRVFQSAEPGPGVTPLVADGPTYAQVIQGEKVVLKVKAEKGMPVTFHTNQLGNFDNLLRTVTVVADDDGIAQATYLAGSGTVNFINILAASPIHSEDVLFIVDVSLPE